MATCEDGRVTTDQVAAFGAAAGLPCDLVLPVDPRHPACHPGYQLGIRSEAGCVVEVDLRIGLMHRSAEKLFESRDVRQAMLLANRHDWLSSFTSEMTVALAAEELLGIAPPERATWIRLLLTEVERISAVVPFLAPVGGSSRPSIDQARANLIAVQESITGARMHPGFARVGGVAAWIVDEDRALLRTTLEEISVALPAWQEAIEEQTASLSGLAVLTSQQAIDFGVGGPVGRASGVLTDLRRDAPYLFYGDLRDLLDHSVRTGGDAQTRYLALLDELPVSVQLAKAALDRLDDLVEGPVDVPLPKVVRLPEAMAYTAVEGPLGISGVLLAGAGDKFPLRLKVRSASLATLQAMEVALVGTPMDQLAAAVMSFPVVMGDADR